MSTVWKPNVTVAAIVERNGRFLLVEEETPDGIRLNQPAGHLDPGETLIDAVVRETLEETARHFVPKDLLGVYMTRSEASAERERITYVRFAFAGSAGEAEPDRPLDAGILRTLWLDVDEIRARAALHRSPLVMKCIDDHLAGQRFPLAVLHAHPSVLA